MANSVYQINKGINKPIEFKGLKAQYILYFAFGVMGLLILFGLLYLMGFPNFICVGLTLIAGTFMTMKLYALSNKYGEHGMIKAIAGRSVPKLVKCKSRKVFIDKKENRK